MFEGNTSSRRSMKIALVVLSIPFFLCLSAVSSHAQVSITSGSGGEDFCVDLTPGSGYVTLSDIVIAETTVTDFVDDAGYFYR